MTRTVKVHFVDNGSPKNKYRTPRTRPFKRINSDRHKKRRASNKRAKKVARYVEERVREIQTLDESRESILYELYESFVLENFQKARTFTGQYSVFGSYRNNNNELSQSEKKEYEFFNKWINRRSGERLPSNEWMLVTEEEFKNLLKHKNTILERLEEIHVTSSSSSSN